MGVYYKSKVTDFAASEPPYTDTVYCKDENKTVCIIHIDKNWNMYGEVIDPYDLFISPVKPIFGPLNQEQCERMLMKDAPKPNRVDVMRELDMEFMDYAKLMYCTRLINLINNYWLAWSEDDKVEDYHPRFNKEIMKKREASMIKLDPEPEDLEPSTPYWVPDWSKSMENFDRPEVNSEIDTSDMEFGSSRFDT